MINRMNGITDDPKCSIGFISKHEEKRPDVQINQGMVNTAVIEDNRIMRIKYFLSNIDEWTITAAIRAM